MLEKEWINPENSSFLSREKTEKFYKLERRPQAQCLVSCLAHGFVNVVQIVHEGNEYFSHIQKFEDKVGKENMEKEVISDKIILALIFCDDDHGDIADDDFSDNNTLNETNKEKFILDDRKEYEEESHNFLIDYKHGKYVFFDFGEAFSENGTLAIFLREDDVLSKLFLYSELPFYKEILENLIVKTNLLLKTNFQDPSFFKAVIKRNEINLDDSQFNFYFSKKKALDLEASKKAMLMFEDIKSRLEIVKRVAEDELQIF